MFSASMNSMWYGNSLHDWLFALGGAVAATLTIALLRRYVIRYLDVAAAKTETRADDYIVVLLQAIRTPLVVAISIAISERFLDLPANVDKIATTLMVIAFAVQGLRWASKTVDFWVGAYTDRPDTHIEASAVGVLKFVSRMVLWTTVVLVALETLHFPVGTFISALSVGGIAIALAVQNILGDLFAALSIWLDKPFIGGDTISVDAFEGTVEHIGLKTTRVRSINGEQLIFSNADLLRSRIRNFSRREGRRLVMTLSIAPGTTSERLARVAPLIAEAVASEPHATLVRAHLNGTGAIGFEFETVVIVDNPDYKLAMEARQRVLLALFARLEREGIALARPVVALAAPLPN